MSKLGSFLAILERVGPVVLSVIPATAPIAGLVLEAIKAAEQIPGATGPEKKQHAQEIAANAVEALQAGGVSIPATATVAAVGDAIDAVVGAVDVVKGTHKAVRVDA